MAKLAIVGTGFTGASLGLALRPSKLFDLIAGFDLDRQRLQSARQVGTIDEASRSAGEAVREAAVVVITAPSSQLASILAELGPVLSPGAVLTDTSLWRVAAERAAAALPEGVHYVGGRPVLDQPGSGPEQASAAAFRRAVYCLTPSAGTSEAAVNTLSAVVSAAGAQPYFLEPAEHDALTAASELLGPALLAALARTLTQDPSWPEAGKLAGANLSRLLSAVEDPPAAPAGPGGREFWQDAAANGAPLGRWLEAVASTLLELRDRLRSAEPAELATGWRETAEALARWHADKRQLQPSTMPPKEELRPNLLGALGRRRR